MRSLAAANSLLLTSTIHHRNLFGWSNVRGGPYCRSSMRAAPAPLADFRRDGTRQFDYLTRREIDEIVGVVRDLAEQQEAMSEGGGSCSSTGSCATQGSSRSTRSSKAQAAPQAPIPMDS